MAVKKIETVVNDLINTIKDKDAVYDGTRTKSMVELGSKPHPQGSIKYSLVVENRQAFIQVALTETFTNMHKAATIPSQKFVGSFSVPITDKKAYDKLCQRFFNMDMNNNAEVGQRVVDEVKKFLE